MRRWQKMRNLLESLFSLPCAAPHQPDGDIKYASLHTWLPFQVIACFHLRLWLWHNCCCSVERTICSPGLLRKVLYALEERHWRQAPGACTDDKLKLNKSDNSVDFCSSTSVRSSNWVCPRERTVAVEVNDQTPHIYHCFEHFNYYRVNIVALSPGTLLPR